MGKRLSVTTNFGYGWREYDPQRQAKPIDTPADFHFVAQDFWESGGELVAVLGLVQEAGHFLNGFELCALPVPYDPIDFEQHPGNYHLLFTPRRAHLTGTKPPPHYDSVVGEGYPEFRGYAGSIRSAGFPRPT
jgi:hypothetical protein